MTNGMKAMKEQETDFYKGSYLTFSRRVSPLSCISMIE